MIYPVSFTQWRLMKKFLIIVNTHWQQFKLLRIEKQTNTGGLAKLVQLKIGSKRMLTVNLEIQCRLINGQAGNIRRIEFA